MNFKFKFVYFFFMILIIFFVKESFNMIFIWMMMEISFFFFFPIIFCSNIFSSAIISIKYFISQTPVSIFILVFLIIPSDLFSVEIFLCLFLLFKLGLPPFHGWMMSMIIDMDFFSLMILSTFQKFIPIYLVNLIYLNQEVLFLSFFLFMIMVMMNMLSFNCMKLILTISSIFNSFWMLVINNIFWELFFFMYFFSLMTICLLLLKLNFSNINSFLFLDKKIKLSFLFLLLNLGGFPPFVMFFSKLLVLFFLFKMNSIWFFILFFFSPFIFHLYFQLIIFSLIKINFSYLK